MHICYVSWPESFVFEPINGKNIAWRVLRQLALESEVQHSEKLPQSTGLSSPDADSSSRSETLPSGPFVLPSIFIKLP